VFLEKLHFIGDEIREFVSLSELFLSSFFSCLGDNLNTATAYFFVKYLFNH